MPASPRQKRRTVSRKRSFHSPQPGRERAEPIAAGADVPGLGDQPRRAQQRVLGEAGRTARAGSKPSARRPSVVARSKRKPSTPPRTVQRQRADRHVDDQRAVERAGVAAARVVDVGGGIVGRQAVVGRVVQAAQRQRRAELVALAGVVEHDVEDHLDARGVQRVDRRAHFRPAAGRQPRIGAPNTTGL